MPNPGSARRAGPGPGGASVRALPMGYPPGEHRVPRAAAAPGPSPPRAEPLLDQAQTPPAGRGQPGPGDGGRSPAGPLGASGRRAWLATLVALLVWACADAQEPARRTVVQRRFDWTVDAPRAGRPAPVGQRLDGAALSDWTLVGQVAARVEGSALVLHGVGPARLEAPAPLLDTRVHDTLSLHVDGRGVAGLQLLWSEDGSSWPGKDAASLAGVDGGERVVRRLELSGIRLTRPARLLPGVALGIDGDETGAPWQLSLHGLELSSVLDRALTTGLDRGAFTRRGVLRPGLAFAAPGRVRAPLEAGPDQALELWLAAAASEDPLELVLEAGPVRQQVSLTPGADWRHLRLPLDDVPAEGAELTLEVGEGAGVVLVGGPLRTAPAAGERPDVLLWLVDTLRADRLSSYGYDAPTDPALAALAGEGVRFERVYAASNWTRPSVSTLHTGVGPERHGNHLPGLAVDPDLPTLAEQFAEAGYLTVSLNTNWQVGQPSGLDAGFDLEVQPRAFPALEPASTLTSAQLVPLLEELLVRHQGTRLFVSIHCLDPHAPYLPPDEDLAAVQGAGAEPPEGAADVAIRFRQRSPRYDAEVLHADRQLARLDELLTALGSRERTLLTVLSDHGEAFAEHGTWGHWRGLHEEEVRVPWVLRWPAGLPAGRVVSSPAGHLDVGPTLLGLAGLPVPPAWDGRDLSAVCRGEQADRPGPVLVVDAVSGTRDSFGQRQLAAVAGPLKLIAEVDTEDRPVPRSLYDLEADPGERRDLLAEGGSVPAHLLQALVDHLARDRRRVDASLDELTVDPQQRAWMEAMGYLR